MVFSGDHLHVSPYRVLVVTLMQSRMNPFWARYQSRRRPLPHTVLDILFAHRPWFHKL